MSGIITSDRHKALKQSVWVTESTVRHIARHIAQQTGEEPQRRQHCGGNERQYFIHRTLEKVMDPSSDVLGPKRIEMYPTAKEAQFKSNRHKQKVQRKFEMFLKSRKIH